LETEHSLGRTHALGVGVLCLAETNVNWGHPQILNKFHCSLRKIWKHSTHSKSFTADNFTSEEQPGGTLTLVCNHWTSRVIERGVDPFGLGRWSYLVLQGKENIKILIITAYRVCRQTIQSAGHKTATAQKFRALSKTFRDADLENDPIPRRQFIVDLQSWIEHMSEEGYQIILSINANETYSTTEGNFTPLHYTTAAPIPIKGHDGILNTLVRTCGLIDPLLLQHSESSPPPTYDRGREKIDFIITSSSLMEHVTQTGMPYNSIFLSDHRPCFLDLDSQQLFRETTPNIEPPQYRGLRLEDPRLIKQYHDALHNQMKYHKILDKANKLLSTAKQHEWTQPMKEDYENLDSLITEALLAAEKLISKKVSNTFQWSPSLSAAIYTLKYWKLRLSQLHGKPISQYSLNKLFQKTTLPEHWANRQTLEGVVNQIRQARGNLKTIQRKHIELRSQHLEDLAEAIVIKRCPSLQEPGKDKEFNKRKLKEIRRIKRKEAISRMHKKIGYTLRPNIER